MACSGNCSSCGEKGSCENEDKKLNEVLSKIGKKIMVLSGKGGVGKSSVAASLAFLLAKAGKRVGLLDLDFHGPSQPTLFGAAHLRLSADENGLLPLEKISQEDFDNWFGMEIYTDAEEFWDVAPGYFPTGFPPHIKLPYPQLADHENK